MPAEAHASKRVNAGLASVARGVVTYMSIPGPGIDMPSEVKQTDLSLC